MRHHSQKKLALIVLALVAVLTMAACGEKTSNPLSSADDGQKILITGLQAQDLAVTIGELKNLPAVTKSAEATRANGETVRVKARGPLLETVLQKHGKSIKDFTTVRLSAKDGYSVAVPPDILKNRLIILAYEIDGERLDKDNQPIRVVIPEERAMYWVRMLERIDLENGSGQAAITKLVFIETAARSLPQEDYKYFESVDKAVKTKDLVEKYAADRKPQNIFIEASDGLKKNESKANFLSAYIKITGKDAPKFMAPQFPQGMHVRDVLYIDYGGTAFYSYGQGKLLQKASAASDSGIIFSNIIKQTGLSRAERYKFSGADGQSIEMKVSELGQGLVYENAPGVLGFRCDGASADQSVKDLVSIECMK